MSTPTAAARRALPSIPWSRVLELPTWSLLGALTVWMFLRTGFDFMPNIHSQVGIAQHPLTNQLPSADSYIWWNWLSPALAHVLGLDSGSTYAVYCCFIALAIVPACYLALRSYGLDAKESRWRMLMVCALPGSFTALFWIGMDGLTVLLLVLVVAARGRRLLSASLGVLCGLQHAEQSLVAIGMVLVVELLSSGDEWQARAAALTGIVAGREILVAISTQVSGAPLSSRGNYFAKHHSEIVHGVLAHPAVIGWSLLGGGWLLLMAARLEARDRLAVGVAIVGAVLLVLTAGDPTRVAAIGTLPVMLTVLSRPSFGSSAMRHPWLVPVALVVPVVWFWSGHNLAPMPYWFAS